MAVKRRDHIYEMLPVLGVAVLMALFILACALDYARIEEQLVLHREGWQVSGEPVEVLPVREQCAAGEVTRLSTVLDERFHAPRAMCFYSVFQNVRMTLDGEEIYRFDRPRGEKMRAAPSYWNAVQIPEGSAGKQLVIELSTPYLQYANVLPEIRSGTLEQVQRYVLLKTMPRFAAALAILLVGLIFAIVAVLMRHYSLGSGGLYSLSLFVVVLALFLAAQQTSLLINLYDGISYILLQNVAFMLCPVLYTRYLMRVYRGSWRVFARYLHWASMANGSLQIALQIFGVRDMPEMMSVTGVLCAVVILYVFYLELRRKRRLLVCLFALLMIYAAVRYYFTDSITWLVYAGIFGYLYILIYRVIYKAVRAQARQIRLEAALEVSKSEIATIQITSHFFYHTLDSIRALIRLDADRAYKMTGDFAKYIRHRVDGVERMQETVPFSRELRSIRAYTDIKQAQLGDRLQMIYDVETQDFEILPLTVQPLVENAVAHAVQHRKEGGCVRLVCRETKNGYHIEVIDNGPDAAQSQPNEDLQKLSIAVKNVNTRLEFYGIAPLKFEKNEMGGMTVSLDTPKRIERKGSAQ